MLVTLHGFLLVPFGPESPEVEDIRVSGYLSVLQWFNLVSKSLANGAATRFAELGASDQQA